MKTKHERLSSQKGNALIYVLIGIALFAALSFVLARQNDTGETGYLSDDKANLYATQLIAYATQTKQVADQMIFSGADINDLDFTPPSDAAFNAGATSDNIYMIYHPDGGGLVPGTIPVEAISQSDTDPVAGWYFGRFNNVDWTKSSAQDVILIAYQIKQEVCQSINTKLGVSTIPTMTTAIKLVMIDEDDYTTGSNVALTTGTGNICVECQNRASLCVQEGGKYGFYSVIADQ